MVFSVTRRDFLSRKIFHVAEQFHLTRRNIFINTLDSVLGTVISILSLDGNYCKRIQIPVKKKLNFTDRINIPMTVIKFLCQEHS